MTTTMNQIALITGASSGLGRHYAHQLAARPEVDTVWLVARRRERMERLADELSEVDTRVFDIDLTDPDQLPDLFAPLDPSRHRITWLVNSAGFGKYGQFDAVPPETNLSMIDLNVRALTEITQRTLSFMQDGSKVLQVASSAGFAPMANFAVYSATKAYVLNLSNALHVELQDRGITVTAVCPGPVDTEFQKVAGEAAGTMESPSFLMASPSDVVATSIKDAERGRLNSVYGVPIKAFAAASRLLPRRFTAWASSQSYEE